MSTSQFFYKRGQISTLISDQETSTILREHEIPISETRLDSEAVSSLFNADSNNSVLNSISRHSSDHFHYSAYGLLPGASPLPTLAYNGEHPSLPNLYLLGNGRRAYSPGLMRFLSPDSLSPFHKGGINPYAYCANDPINYTDPSGQMRRGQTGRGVSPTARSFFENAKKKIDTIRVHQRENKTRITNLKTKIQSNGEKYRNVDKLYGTGPKVHPETAKKAQQAKDKIIVENVQLKEELQTHLRTKEHLAGSIRDINTELHASVGNVMSESEYTLLFSEFFPTQENSTRVRTT
ncbi:RHS repeat-associated protein [Pseudomonas putida]|uniref:RHS repeat-associated core domain-containing protein n=1 Tax=Pseudomonas putida TaxID=303 RepID=UPI0010441CA2|nr:RHS repeat-associated protein [Pseudomonas putida]